MAVYILRLLYSCFYVNFETKYWKETEKIENSWNEYSDLFTITCDVKPNFNNSKKEEEDMYETLENTGVQPYTEKEENLINIE